MRREALDGRAGNVAPRKPDAGELGLGHVAESVVALGDAAAFQHGIEEAGGEPDHAADRGGEKQRKDRHGGISFRIMVSDSYICRNDAIFTNTYRIAAGLMLHGSIKIARLAGERVTGAARAHVLHASRKRDRTIRYDDWN
jgi:hypothetical protein